MSKKSWLLVLPLVAGLLSLGSAPGRAAGENWVVKSVRAVGCADSAWILATVFSGVDGGGYTAHTVVRSGGETYMNEDAEFAPDDGADQEWRLFHSDSYGPTTAPYPIPSGQQMKVTFTLERPKGTVLSSYTMVAASCDSTRILYSGPTNADLDNDFVATPADRCPTLRAFSPTGCPLRARTLTLRAASGPRRVAGRLDSPGFRAFSAGRAVTIWQVRRGPDRAVARRTTSRRGTFAVRVGRGRYYATATRLVVPRAGTVDPVTSRTVRVH